MARRWLPGGATHTKAAFRSDLESPHRDILATGGTCPIRAFLNGLDGPLYLRQPFLKANHSG